MQYLSDAWLSNWVNRIKESKCQVILMFLTHVSDTQVQVCKNLLSLTAGISNFRDFFKKFVWRDQSCFFVTDPRFLCHLTGLDIRQNHWTMEYRSE